MTTLNPDGNNRQQWDWSLPSSVPLASQLAHRVACDEIDNCTNCEELRSAAKSYHALYKKTQHMIGVIQRQDLTGGFPTNMDGV